MNTHSIAKAAPATPRRSPTKPPLQARPAPATTRKGYRRQAFRTTGFRLRQGRKARAISRGKSSRGSRAGESSSAVDPPSRKTGRKGGGDRETESHFEIQPCSAQHAKPPVRQAAHHVYGPLYVLHPPCRLGQEMKIPAAGKTAEVGRSVFVPIQSVI